VVLMAVGKDEGAHVLLVFLEEGDVGHHQVHAEELASGNIIPESTTMMSSA